MTIGEVSDSGDVVGGGQRIGSKKVIDSRLVVSGGQVAGREKWPTMKIFVTKRSAIKISVLNLLGRKKLGIKTLAKEIISFNESFL